MKLHQYNEMMAYLTRPKFQDGGPVVPPKKPYTDTQFKKRVDILIQGIYGTGPEYKDLAVQEIQKELDKAEQEGVLSRQEGINFLRERKKYYDDYLNEQRKTTDGPLSLPSIEERTELQGGSDPKTGQGFQKGNTGFRTKDGEVRNIKGTNQFTPKTTAQIQAIIDNPKYKGYTPTRFEKERILTRTDTKNKDVAFQKKGITPADPEKQKTKKAISSKKRVGAIKKLKGLPYSYSGTKANPKGHAGNIYGKNIITPSEIIYTPEKINLAMSGKKGIEKFDKTNPMKSLDFKIQQTEKQIEDIKKSNMSSAKKKTELAKLDNKLVNYVSKSGGYKIATLSDNTKYGKIFQGLKSLDMFDEFEGKSEKQMNDFIKKYKNMKVGKNTTQADKDNKVKAIIAAENIKNAKKNAARGGGGTQMFDPFKPSGLSPLRKTKYLAGGGPVYGKYAKQIKNIKLP